MGRAIISVSTELLEEVLNLCGVVTIIGAALPSKSPNSIDLIVEGHCLPDTSAGKQLPYADVECTKIFTKVKVLP